MNKNLLGTLIGLGLLVVLAVVFNAPNSPLGIALDEAEFSTATDAKVDCLASATTSVIAAQPGRSSAIFTLNPHIGATSTILCRSANACTALTGIVLTTSDPRYEQRDGYKGAYVCRTSGSVSSTIGVSYSQ